MINYEVALGQFELFVLILIRLASFVYAALLFLILPMFHESLKLVLQLHLV